MNRLQERGWFASAAGLASLLGTALLIAGLIPPFVAQVCPGCSAFDAASLPDAMFRDSPDAWAVVWIASVLVASAVLFLAGVARYLVARVSAATSLAALGLAIFEGAVAFPRVLDAAELVPGGLAYALESGYYLCLIGAVVAVGAAAAMLLVSGHEEDTLAPRGYARPSVQIAVRWLRLSSLALAFAGMFVSFAGLHCGFGCPPFQPPHTRFDGAMIGSADGWIVLTLVAGAMIATALRLTGRGSVLATRIALLLSLAAAGLVSFDSLHAATRVLGWAYEIPTSPELGYFLIQAGSASSVVLSFVLMTADGSTWGLRRRAGPRVPAAVHPA